MGIVDRIKELSAAKNMTIAELERKLDFANSSIRKWDNQSPSSIRLQKVAEYFNVSVDYLLGLTDNPSRISQPTTEGNGFLRIDLSDVPEEDKDNVVEQLETFKRFLISETAKEAERRKNGNSN
ncbi:helix-turn-helix domain-containing protein [Carnobacterium maltaromaticum]|uniref:helix-turn-helix domain-containing protein n=1 Tax=Carnobacterium maltaromaticum TaxID=2751 RepID=UPI00165B6571|nr:helix-turn-helix transcriptional regulator [Carnobacterium maltaromaticum]MBC9787220.1 helix-turn-helix domain-containing protein [Carnobacterium maltaromaticum]